MVKVSVDNNLIAKYRRNHKDLSPTTTATWIVDHAMRKLLQADEEAKKAVEVSANV